MKSINVGDYIYAARTKPSTGEVVVDYLIVSKVTKAQVRTDTTTPAFSYTQVHLRESVFTSSREALLAYREKTVQLLLTMGRALAKGHVTLDSIDDQLELRGE